MKRWTFALLVVLYTVFPLSSTEVHAQNMAAGR